MDHSADVEAIRTLIERQFKSLSFGPDRPADFANFASDFHPEAMLVASARPARPQSVESFVKRMDGLFGDTLNSFHERSLGCAVHVFGSVAMAAAACENSENGADINHNVEMLLLVKEDGRWRIVAQAWDKVTPERPLPAWLTTTAATRTT